MPTMVSFLYTEFEKRRAKNAHYSLRAFARDLGVSAGVLSQVLQGKRPISLKLVESIVSALGLDQKSATKLKLSVAEIQLKRNLKRLDPQVKELLRFKGSSVSYKNPRVLDAEVFNLISRWYCAAILELTFLKDFKLDAGWIAEQLGISPVEARLTILRLKELGLLTEDSRGLVRKINDHLELSDPARTSQARRTKQIEIRQKAIESIHQDPIESRHMTSMTICIDPELLPQARTLIEKFNDELADFLESKSRKRVYALEIGLFPLQRIKSALKKRSR